MPLRSSLPVTAVEVPCIFRTAIGNISYYFGFNYNEVGNFYTVDLYDVNMRPIVLGEKMILDQPLFQNETDQRIPLIPIVPMDEANVETAITSDNFGKTVFLFLDTLPYESGNLDTAFKQDDNQFGG